MAPPVIYLHIGAMKTGTTYLQKLMEANAAALEEAGFLFPVEGTWGRQMLAARDVLRMYGDKRTRTRATGKWDQVAERMLTYSGKAAIFSMEFLSYAESEDAQRVLQTFDGADVRVILTVRDASTAIPAQWQTAARNGYTESWSEFAEQIMAEDPDSTGYRVFHRSQDVARMLGVWLQHIPAEHFQVVTVPPDSAPKELLWERFAAAVGVDPAVCSQPPRASNESIGAASAELMRRINAELGNVNLSEYRPTVKKALSGRILSQRAKQEGKARTNLALREFAARSNQQSRTAIAEAGVPVIGDLDDLSVEVDPVPEGEPDELTVPADTEILESAAFAVPKMHQVLRRRRNRLLKAGAETDTALPERPAEPRPDHWYESEDPVGAAVAELAALAQIAIELQRQIYAVRDYPEPAAAQT